MHLSLDFFEDMRKGLCFCDGITAIDDEVVLLNLLDGGHRRFIYYNLLINIIRGRKGKEKRVMGLAGLRDGRIREVGTKVKGQCSGCEDGVITDFLITISKK